MKKPAKGASATKASASSKIPTEAVRSLKNRNKLMPLSRSKKAIAFAKFFSVWFRKWFPDPLSIRNRKRPLSKQLLQHKR
jgi:hypothetical protein